MAEVAEMGEIDEIHSTEENSSILLNGDITKDITTENSDGESSDDQDVDTRDVSVNKISLEETPDNASLDSNNDVEIESKDDATSQSGIDDDSQDSQDSQISHDAKSQSSQDSQDSNVEQIAEENGSLPPEGNEDTNTNGSLPQRAEEDVNEGDDSSSSSSSSDEGDEDEKSESTALDQTNEDSQDSNDKKSDSHEDSSESKTESAKNDESMEKASDNGEVEAAKVDSQGEIKVGDGEEEEKTKASHTIELNSEDEDDVQLIDVPKTNGTEVIDLIDTPEKQPPSEQSGIKADSAPRRSSRNLNKNKSYVESEKEESPPPEKKNRDSEGSDVEEVLPQDPLAVSDQITVERIPSVKKVPAENASTIVVKDTKRLVEIATKSNSNAVHSTTGKKEPTLVIIDTNSILSGRGPVPVTSSKSSSGQQLATTSFTSVLPVAVPAQGMYPPNMRATITPIPVSGAAKASPIMASTLQPAVPPLLPTLTDDMFVVEAPSFIVPYVYEKPPNKDLKNFVAVIKKELTDTKKRKKDKKDKGRCADKDSKRKKKDEDEDSESFSSEDESEDEKPEPDIKKPYSYFESPLGKFFIDIGFNMVQEFVQSDLLKQQKRKRDREQGSNPETNKTIASLIKNIEMSKSNNEHFKMPVTKCEFCNFKTESKLAMAYHLETPHMKNFVYKCNFCSYEVRSPHDILFHMEAEHAVRGHLERAPAFHQCPSCPFEDNQKGKLSRHLVVCARKFKPDRNLEPPPDWEPPAKIPRMPKMRATGLNATVQAYQTLAANKNAQQQYQFLSKMQLQATAAAASALNRGRGRPSLGPTVKTQPIIRPQGMIFKQQTGGQVLVPANYQLSGNQVFQVVGGSELGGRLGSVPGMAFIPSTAQAASKQTTQVPSQQTAKKPSNTPSISITPLPRGTTATPTASKPGDTSSKNSFVICEICDGYIKDLEQLRNHMQWIHKIKIHPKMIYNRPPLNCQKCQFRFFTDQGLERHLLGSHGLVTSSMQDAANKSKDSGRCPVCGRVYQWKLLNHVARDHNMTLKPAHLSYKCTVCTATFGMYKQFENHVYSAHSVVAKRVMDKKTASTSSGSSPAVSAKNTDLKPLKINDEITIIPQPPKSTNGAKEGSPAPKAAAGSSKNNDEAATSSRAERLARRNAPATDSN
ncbi:MOG interacting and ectopic P-granules protein 1 isoform X1 [Euwallacea similis]|uniref:MOG interacting and ectopic P-granules protein 1 isoform X1 n=1 Tax=Euwallacea similis TaxID=1736056 RepID=UPI00344F6A51